VKKSPVPGVEDVSMDWTTGIVAPSDAELTASHAEIGALVDASGSAHAWRDAFGRWDSTRRTWRSYANLTRLRYSQDTRSEANRDAQQRLDRRSPTVTALDTAMKQRFLKSPARPQLESELGTQAFALWDADVTTFDDAIKDDLVRESELTRAYTELLATAEVDFTGERRSLGGLGTFLQSPDREVRHAAESARWDAFADRAQSLDRLFDDLVHLRDGMARKLGLASYTELGYRRMRRVDYGPDDVARYRDEVARVIVPLAHDLVRRFGAEKGLDRVRFWDESTLSVGCSIAPRGDRAWILARTRDAFAAIDPALGDFANMLIDGDLLDVENRPGKALGAYCTSFPTRSVPFVFANFNGSRGDIRTLMHELGHAFQNWSSRNKAAIDYLTPTFESAEIHSMALEYLSWPQMERYFGDDAPAFRREHLFDAMLFLPYGVAVDHFQHLVYAHPSATPAERHEMWREMERRYLPWRDYGDLAYPAAGALWQEKRHIYAMPFYYIDYTLALCCALQFWNRAESDRESAMSAYVALCARGGEAPFRDLVKSAGLRVPFEAGALEDVARAASAAF
jgi:M3 family oligoendopeptidase